MPKRDPRQSLAAPLPPPTPEPADYAPQRAALEALGFAEVAFAANGPHLVLSARYGPFPFSTACASGAGAADTLTERLAALAA